jgi:Na+/proline symporter
MFKNFKNPERVANWTHWIMYTCVAVVFSIAIGIKFTQDPQIIKLLAVAVLICGALMLPTMYLATQAIRQQSREQLNKELERLGVPMRAVE